MAAAGAAVQASDGIQAELGVGSDVGAPIEPSAAGEVASAILSPVTIPLTDPGAMVRGSAIARANLPAVDSRDSALLSWLAAQPVGGLIRQDSVRSASPHDSTTDETIDSIPAAVDDVFAGLAVAL